MLNFFTVLILALILPQAAAADPVSAAITAFSAWAATSATTALIARVLVYAAGSALMTALTGKTATAAQSGITTEVTTSGGTNAQTFILGLYATAGNRVAPPYSGPNRADVPNEFLSFVADISDIPVNALKRVAVNGDWVDDLQAYTGSHALAGLFGTGNSDDLQDLLTGVEAPLFQFTFYDGTQTAADPYMVASHGTNAERPWQSDMVGAGVAYAVLTFKYNRKTFNGLPTFLFEVEGVKLYDPRRDGSVGGSGAQRWANPATWAFTQNPAVMIYNILRGITLPDGAIYGGRAAAADLPLANWFAAMNECDVQVTRSDGATVAQYVAGFEVSLDSQPADVIDVLKNACAGEIVEVGGVYTMRAGPVSMPVYFFTDADLSVDDLRLLTPHGGLDDVHNALYVTHPSRDAMWAQHDAPALFDAEAEADDGRRLDATLDLPAVARDEQVQRLMSLWLKDDRRMRRHDLTLPPDAAALDPLDAIAWTSARNEYTAKVFEIGEIVDDFTTVMQTVSVRERDADDANWTAATDEITVIHPGTGIAVLPVRVLPLWRIEAAFLADDTGTARRAGLRLQWDGTALGDCTGIRVQVRLYGTTDLVTSFVIANIAAGDAFLFDAILPGLHYEARARLVSNRDTGWTAWADAIAPAIYLTESDFDAGVRETLGRVDDVVGEIHQNALDDLDAALAAVRAQQSEAGARSDARADVVRIAAASAAAAAAVIIEATARADADGAQATVTQALRAEFDALGEFDASVIQADILNLQTVKVDATGAVAAVTQEVSASYASLSAMASTLTYAEAQADSITGGFVLRGTAGAGVVSLSGAVRADANGATYSKIAVDADSFQINGDLSAVAATFGSFQTGTAGGARTVISGPNIRVYDNSGALVVAIGDLAGLV
jgi:hypothetical protein